MSLSQFAAKVSVAARAWHAVHGEGDPQMGGAEDSTDDEGQSEGASESGTEAEGESDGEGGDGDSDAAESNGVGEGAPEWELPADSPLVADAQNLAAAYNLLPDGEGSGLYPALALINHSCAANVAIEFLGDAHEAAIVALRPIAKGEEVRHRYYCS